MAGDDTGVDQYVRDPERPVPFSARIRTTLGHLWKVEDQRFASTRPDVLVYESEVLEEDLTIAGPILAQIFVSTTGTDSDWVVKLIDVFPDDAPESAFCEVPMGGYQMHLAGEIMRGRFRNSFEKPEPMVSNRITSIRIDLRDRYHTFKAGAPDHGPRPEFLVPGLRPQPANLRRHLSGQAQRLPDRDTEGVPFGSTSIPPGAWGDEINRNREHCLGDQQGRSEESLQIPHPTPWSDERR